MKQYKLLKWPSWILYSATLKCYTRFVFLLSSSILTTNPFFHSFLLAPSANNTTSPAVYHLKHVQRLILPQTLLLHYQGGLSFDSYLPRNRLSHGIVIKSDHSVVADKLLRALNILEHYFFFNFSTLLRTRFFTAINLLLMLISEETVRLWLLLLKVACFIQIFKQSVWRLKNA